MSKVKWIPVAAVLMILGLFAGCESNNSDSNGDGGGATGSYAGTWTGHVAGRGLTLTLVQNGTTLSGTYVLTNPTFSEPVNGTVSSLDPPATAVLTALDTRQFNITFSSYNAFSGTFYNLGKTLDTSGTK